MFSRSIAMFFHGKKMTDSETADQQICDVSLNLRVSCVSVVKTFMTHPGYVIEEFRALIRSGNPDTFALDTERFVQGKE